MVAFQEEHLCLQSWTFCTGSVVAFEKRTIVMNPQQLVWLVKYSSTGNVGAWSEDHLCLQRWRIFAKGVMVVPLLSELVLRPPPSFARASGSFLPVPWWWLGVWGVR